MTDLNTSRSRLLTLLAEACELEHALGCSYLFAAFSLKKDIGEGLTWEQQQHTRRWASQVFHIAAQEMLHLGQAWNLIIAIGGSPYYGRPGFPRPAKWFPLPVALTLRRYDQSTLDRFVYYESPAHDNPEQANALLPDNCLWPLEESFEYSSVGQLYVECARIIREFDGPLILGSPNQQVGQRLVHFPDIIEVVDQKSALNAITRITLQGEGIASDRSDSHYAVFGSLQNQFRIANFDPARPVGDNPFVRRRRQDLHIINDMRRLSSAIQMTEITDTLSLRIADLFDDVYIAMLQALTFLYTNPCESNSEVFSQVALELMTTVIRPIGEALCQLPSGQDNTNAGPGFAIWRSPYLSNHPTIASHVMKERLKQLSERSKIFASSPELLGATRDQIRSGSFHLGRLADLLQCGR